MATPSKLSYEVFVSEPIPFSDTDRAPNGDRVATTPPALEFYNAMIELYPDRLNPSALWFWGAKTLFES